MQAKISKRLLDSITPTDTDLFLWDTEVKGFGVKVTPAGKRSYVLQYRIAGRLRRFTIGVHGSPWTPDQARQEAVKLLAQIAKGIDPAEMKAQAKTTPTIAETIERFHAEYVAPMRKTRTIAEYRRLFDKNVIPHIGSIRIDAIQRKDVLKLHNAMKDTPYQANRVLALLSKLFNWAEQVGLRHDRTNPVLHVSRFTEEKRERLLQDSELSRLGQALADAEQNGSASPYAVAAIRLLILTGARLNEILTLEWAAVDFQYGALRLSDSKTGAKAIPLNPPAMDLLSNLPRIEGNPHVICGRIAGHSMVNINKPWLAIRAAAGLNTLRLHDLRHAFASVGATMGMSLPIIGKLLGHTHATTTQRYAHLSDDPLKKATNQIGNHIQAAMDSRPPLAEIIPFPIPRNRASQGG